MPAWWISLLEQQPNYICALLEILKKRRSLRRYASEPLSLPELSFLLWATQGVSGPNPQFRTAPSAGGRHPFETYIAALSVADLPIGLYRYLPLQHKLLPLREKADLAAEVATACYNQPFITGSAVVSCGRLCRAHRMALQHHCHKMIAIDAGHVCQNLYLAAESIGAGACAIGKYHQERMDQFLGVTGETEFAIYAAAVGKR